MSLSAPAKGKSIEYHKYHLLQLVYLLQDNGEKFNEVIKNGSCRFPLENEMYVSSRRAFAKKFTPFSRLGTFAPLAEVEQSFNNAEKWTKPT